MKKKYLVVDTDVLPDVYTKIVKAKELLREQSVGSITEAIKSVGISRSSFYKYKDFVFTISQSVQGRKCTISMLLGHHPGTLSRVLNIIASKNGNVLTINQDIPINNIANVSITLDISSLDCEMDLLMNEIEDTQNVLKVELIAME